MARELVWWQKSSWHHYRTWAPEQSQDLREPPRVNQVNWGGGVNRNVTHNGTCDSSATCVGAIDPLGRYLYVLNAGDQTAVPPVPPKIYAFTITQPTAQTGKTGSTVGTLTAITGSPFSDPSFNVSDWIMIDHTGQFLYVVNNANGTTQNQGTITEFSITQSGSTAGALTPLPSSSSTPNPIPAGNGSNGPFFGTIDRNNNLFVANLGSSSANETVSAFSIDANTGQLTSLGPDAVISNGTINASATINVITSPVANNLYVLDAGPGSGANGQVFAYSYAISGTPATITLTPIGTTTQPTGPNAFGGMAIDPTGTLLLIDDFGQNTTPPTNGSVFSYAIGSNGGLPSAPANVAAGVGTEFVTIYSALSGQ